MSEDFEENEHKGAKYLIQLVDRYEQMLADETQYFFDAEELEDIVEYYIEKNNTKKSLQAIEFAIGQYPFSTIFSIKKILGHIS